MDMKGAFNPPETARGWSKSPSSVDTETSTHSFFRRYGTSIWPSVMMDVCASSLACAAGSTGACRFAGGLQASAIAAIEPTRTIRNVIISLFFCETISRALSLLSNATHRESKENEECSDFESPLGRLKDRQHSGCDFNQQASRDGIHDGHATYISAFEFGHQFFHGLAYT